MSKEKSEGKELKKALLSQKKNAVLKMKAEDIKKSDKFCEGYKKFLDAAKTEREAVEYTVKLLKDHGFIEFKPGMGLKAGDKVYVNNRGKAVIMAVIGSEDIKKGVKLCAAHIDSPRLDLKQCPVYEDTEMALFKTHYYGGIKKYQWTVIPLALHGVIVKADGSKVTVTIGEDEDDPVFCVNDLLPHLAQDQMKRNLAQGIKGEELNIVIGSRPFKEDGLSEAVKLNIMNILNEKYGIVEDDFLSAELEAVPAFKAKDIGFDRSMIGAYGHDDRVCAYTALMATVKCKNPKYTAVTILTDKEETGSDGNTGLNSEFMRYFIADLAEAEGEVPRRVLSKSVCISADVTAAYDPHYASAYEAQNSCYINGGLGIAKYTGSRGKSGSNDASAEYVARIRRVMGDAGVSFQTAELGKVDVGGGGTIAYIPAKYGMDVIDSGVPVLSMHAPWEVTSKADIYEAFKGYEAFLKNA